MHQWGTRRRRLTRRRYRGQRIDIGEHGLGGVLRLLGGFRDHHRDGFADIAYTAGRQRALRRARRGRAIPVLVRRRRHVADPGRVEVLGQDDRADARHLASRLDIDAVDDAVRHPAAHHHRVELVRPVQIVGVAALAAQQHRVFLARHRLSDCEFLGRQQSTDQMAHSSGQALAQRRHRHIQQDIARAQPDCRSPIEVDLVKARGNQATATLALAAGESGFSRARRGDDATDRDAWRSGDSIILNHRSSQPAPSPCTAFSRPASTASPDPPERSTIGPALELIWRPVPRSVRARVQRFGLEGFQVTGTSLLVAEESRGWARQARPLTHRGQEACTFSSQAEMG